MIYLHNDYAEGCHEKVLEILTRTNYEQTPGYGEDHYCAKAADLIREKCGNLDLAVHFLVGGTQANMTVIDAALRPHQGALTSDEGHIHSHETGAVESTGHKVLALPNQGGKITPEQIRRAVDTHRASESFEHATQPKMVYVSSPTELGTLYTLAELEAISAVCREKGLYFFLDGARLGYGMTAKGSDVTLPDLARLCDVFYIGGTKCGALFGEAVVIANPAIKEDFRYLIKQHGGMLAKGRLLGLQFIALMEDDLYFRIAKQANDQADQIREALDSRGVRYLVPTISNQIFPIFPDELLEKLEKEFVFTEMSRIDENHTAKRIVTSWATRQEHVDLLCRRIRES